MSDGLVPRSIRYLFDCINQARQGVSDGQTTFRYVLLLEGYMGGGSRGVTSSTDPKCEFCLEDICVLSSWCYFVEGYMVGGSRGVTPNTDPTINRFG